MGRAQRSRKRAAPQAQAAPPPKASAAKRKKAQKLRQKADALEKRAALYAALADNGASGGDLRVVRAAVAGARARRDGASAGDGGAAQGAARARAGRRRRGRFVRARRRERARLDVGGDDAGGGDAAAGGGDDAAAAGGESSDDGSSAGDEAAPPAPAPAPTDVAAAMMRQLAALQAQPAPPEKPKEAPASADIDAPTARRSTATEPTGRCDAGARPGARAPGPDGLRARSAPAAGRAHEHALRGAARAAARPAWMPRVRRTAAERAARLRLPACGAEQEIVDAVRGADVVVLSGATGSGKSTQVPQFLYEAGLCGPRGLRVVATQPRRVAVVATAERVARELGAADPGAARDALVAYRTRYDRGGLGPATRLVFETDGVLLRELERDLLLRDYGAAVVDEAHERSLTTDLLLGLLGRSVALRRAEFERARAAGEPDVLAPLKVVVMSATLDARALSRRELWPAPPRLVELEGRQHPVSVHFARETVLEDYAGAALEVVRRVHREAADDGAILVFLTGRREIEAFCGELRSDRTLDVRPLYAQMALEAQREAFAPTRAGRARKVVVATDVAETSLTIPGARPASGRRRLRPPPARPQASSTSSTAAARGGRSSSTPRPAPSPTASAGSAARTPTSAAAARGARGRATATGSTARRSTRRRSRRRRSRSCCACRWSTSSSGSRRWACATRPPSPSRTAPPPPASVEAACESLARLGALELRRPYARAPLSASAGRWRRSRVGARHAASSPTRAASPRVWRPPSGTRSPRWPSRASRPPPSGRRAATARPRASAGPSATRWATPRASAAARAGRLRRGRRPGRVLRRAGAGRRRAGPRGPVPGVPRAGPPADGPSPPPRRRASTRRDRSCVKAGVFAAVPALAALAPASAAADARLAPVPRGRRPRPGRAARGARSGRRGGAAGRRVAGRALGPAVARREPAGLRLRAARRRRLLLRPPGLRGARADARRPAGVCRVRDRLLGERSPAPRGRDRGRGTAPRPGSGTASSSWAGRARRRSRRSRAASCARSGARR